MNKFAEIVNHYCATDDWTNLNLERSNMELVLMKRKDGLYVRINVEKDRLIAYILDIKDAKITVSLQKSVDTIIKEIDQRLIKSNSAAWERLLAEKEKERLTNENQQAIIQRLCKAAGVEIPKSFRGSFYGRTYSTGATLHSCQVNSDSTYLTLRNIPIDMALEIIQILKRDE